MTKSALVLFSGGQDSTTCLAWALEKYEKVETIGFKYNQRHSVEINCRKLILENIKKIKLNWGNTLGCDHLIDLSFMSKLGDSSLTNEIEFKLSENGLPNTFVPGRNLFFFISAAAIAYRRNIPTLVGGMCETDFSGYPDCRDKTIKSLSSTITHGFDMKVEIETPLMWITKAETWQLAKKIGSNKLVDLIIKDTHTCYAGDRSKIHEWGFGCSYCPACKLRKNGFKEFKSRNVID